MSIKRAFLSLLLLWCGGTSVAGAAVILDSTADGTIQRHFSKPFPRPIGTTTYSFSDLNKVGWLVYPACLGCAGGPQGPDESYWRAYYVFDLATVGFPVTQATFEMQLSPSHAGLSNVISLFALETLSATQLSGLSAASSQLLLASAFTDIGAGAVYGSRNVTGAGTFAINLTPVALDGINAANGLFALGVFLPMNSASFYEFNGFNISGASLTLAGATAPGTVPVPGTAALLAVGGILLFRRRRVSRQ